jgi:hypothetical protein
VKGGIFLGVICRFAKTQELIYGLHLSPGVKTQNRRSSSSCRRTDRPWRTEVYRFQSSRLRAARDLAEARNGERRTGKLKGVLAAGGDRWKRSESAANLDGGRLGRRTGDNVLVNLRGRRRTPWMWLVDAKLLVMSDYSGLALGRRIVWSSGGMGRRLSARIFTDGGAPVNFRQWEPSAELRLHVLVASPCSGDDELATSRDSARLHSVGDVVRGDAGWRCWAQGRGAARARGDSASP